MTSDNSQSLSKITKNILNQHGIKLNKNLGQNYLIDKNKRDQIINFGNIDENDVILEIGTGIGTLTIELAKKAKKVIAIEQDKKIYEILAKRLKEEKLDNVELINDDALNVDFPKFNKIISNLPYQISSPITFKFLDYDFDLAILMYQKEFAERMNGEVGTKNYSRLSAMLYFKCNVEKLTDVSSESFLPKPEIDSTVVRLTPKENRISDDDFKVYSNFTKALFQHRNKKIRNALIDSRHIITDLDKKEMKKRLNEIESVIVYGHSCSKVDKPYFQKVAESIKDNANWRFYVHDIRNNESVEKFAQYILKDNQSLEIINQ